MSEGNKALIQRFVEEAFNEGNLDAADEVYAPGFVSHGPAGPVERGPAYVKQFLGTYRGAFPDGRTTVEDVIAEGDGVAYLWSFRGTHQGELMSIPRPGRR